MKNTHRNARIYRCGLEYEVEEMTQTKIRN